MHADLPQSNGFLFASSPIGFQKQALFRFARLLLFFTSRRRFAITLARSALLYALVLPTLRRLLERHKREGVFVVRAIESDVGRTVPIMSWNGDKPVRKKAGIAQVAAHVLIFSSLVHRFRENVWRVPH